MTGRAPTIRDVAARAGVSVATASNVVNGNRSVGEASRARVQEAIAALGYRLDRAASGLRGSSTRLIGMVVPDITNVFFAGLVHGVEEMAESDGYDLLLASSGEDPSTERRRIEALMARRLDGLLVVPVTDGSMAALADARLPPTVLIDRGAGAPGMDTVSADGEAAGYEATRYLIGLGHRDIAVLIPSDHLANIAQRVAGYRRALREARLAERARVIVGGRGGAGLRGAIESELRRPDRPTAIFALTNICALCAIKAARSLRLDIPRDVSLVGFDDFEWMTALQPYLTTVAQPIEQFAIQSWRLLKARIADSAQSVERVELPCTFKIRDSTGPARRTLEVVGEA